MEEREREKKKRFRRRCDMVLFEKVNYAIPRAGSIFFGALGQS
jgi:hypothetical protein